VLARLTSPLSRLLMAAASARSRTSGTEFADTAAITVVLASEGYPEAPRTGRAITDWRPRHPSGSAPRHAATAVSGDELVATGDACSTSWRPALVRRRARPGVCRSRAIGLEGSHYRRDAALALD
jgi:phosphoribosylamine--glycine ligase